MGYVRSAGSAGLWLVWMVAALACNPTFAAVTPTGSVVTVGGDPSDDGPVQPTSGDLIVPITDDIVIGDLSALIIDGGSFVQAGSIVTDPVGTANLLITGAGTSVEALGSVQRLSIDGQSTASILDGAVYDGSNPAGCVFATCNTLVGSFSGSDAQLTVSGAGSRLDATSAIVIGSARVVATPIADAVGRLIIENGGVVNGDRSSFAQGTFGDTSGNAISRGFLEVRGAGSQFNVSEVIMGNDVGDLDFGEAAFLIEDQGAVNVQTAIVAGLGVNTDATIDVLSGATLSAQAVYASRGAGSVSVINADGAGTALNIGDEFVVGQSSVSSFNLTGGASLNIGGGANTGFIGSGLTFGAQGGTGSGLIDNASVLISPNTDLPEVRLSVGLQGTGDLIIQNGATVRVEDLTAGLGQLGDGVTVAGAAPGLPANGNLLVQGTGTTLSIDTIDLGAFVVGVSPNGVDAAVGVVDILDGATLDIRGTGFNSGINLARGGNSQATMNVSGAGSSVNVVGPQGVIVIGADFGGEVGDGDGLFTVTDTATVSVAGLTPGQGFFNVGQGTGNGALVVNTGGVVNVDGQLNVSFATNNNNSQTGQVTVDDTGVINALQVFVGNRGLIEGTGSIVANELNVFAGGQVTLDSLAGFADVVLDGGSYAPDAGDVTLGSTAGQSVVLRNGGSFFAPTNLQVGAAVGTGGASLTVDGLDSLFDVTDDVTINDSVTLNNGGQLNSGGNVVIGSGGLLAGDGGTLSALSTQVNAGGAIGPGNSPGVLDIVGDLSLDGGDLQFEIGGNQPGEFDVLNIDGDLNLNTGTVGVSLLNNFNPGGQSFDLISASGDINVGTGVAFVNNGPGPDFEFAVRNVGGFDLGTVTFTAFDIGTIPSLNGKQLAMANYLDDLCPRIELLANPGDAALDLDARCGNLRNGNNTPAQIGTALEQLTPDEVVGTFSSLLRHSPIQHGNLARRLNGLRSGASRVDVSNLNIVTDSAQVSGEDLQRMLEELSSDKFQRWGFFSEGRFNFGDRDDTLSTPGFDFDNVAITMGTDYKLTENMYLGLAVGFNEVNADFDVGGGVLMQTYTVSLLGTYFRGDSFYIDGLFTYGSSDVDTSREIFYQDVGGVVARKARGSTDGEQFAAGLGTGFDFSAGRWVWGPHAGFSYSDTLVEDFEERGASGLNLAMPETVSRSVTANAGLHTSVTFAPSWGVVVPYAQVDYVREFKDNNESEKVRFVEDTFGSDPLDPTSPVRVDTGGVDANYLIWAVGVHLQFIRGIAGFIDYRGTAGLDDLDISEIAVGLRYERRL